jgi:tripartite-type tricarboxylate transporter receptor subunit TctC
MYSFDRRGFLAACASMAAAPLAKPALAQTPFYAGKTITIVCGFAPGGGVDLGTRLIANYIGRFIPGSPTIVVQNTPGANGLTAVNYLYAKATPDGLTLSVPGRDWILKPTLGFTNARFDATRLQYIGSTGATNSILYLRADVGVKSLDDLRHVTKPILLGALPGTSSTGLVPKILKHYSFPLEPIIGYDSTSRILIAIEQKEVAGIYTPEATFGNRPDMITNGLVVPIMQAYPFTPKLPVTEENVPPEARPLIRLAQDHARLGMPLVAPPQTPSDRVSILRDAFMQMVRDPEFQERAKTINEPTDPISGEDLQKKLLDILSLITPDAVARYQAL